MRLALVLLLASLAFAQSEKKKLPDGPGKATVEKICSGCHPAENVVGREGNRQKWEEVIATMIERGAEGTDAQFDEIVNYLVKNFPPKKAKGSEKSPQNNRR